MTELPDVVTRALGIHSEIATDLAHFGGVLRCAICSAEQPVGDIASHLRSGWPKCCGLTMTWMTLKLLAAERWEPVPEGYELVAAEEDSQWQVYQGAHCRRLVKRRGCGRPSVAALNRGRRTKRGNVDAWWPYCIDHLYGRWIEDGRVMHWIPREKAGDS